MKKYLMFGLAVLALASCSKNDDVYDASRDKVHDTYNAAFRKYVGVNIAPNQTWGFGTDATRSIDFTRSATNPSVAEISQPYDEAWVTEYNKTAKEPTQDNTTDNYDNSTYAINYGTGGPNDIDWNNAEQVAEKDYFFSLSWEQQIEYAKEHHPSWIVYNADENYVTNFKITGTYNGEISVAGSEGIIDGGTLSHAERTIVVTGTWNISVDQRIGSLGKIIIANGGTVNVASGKTLNMVNQARLVVLPGGQLTGAGKVEVNNGNAAGQENYNGGTIDVATFNNNFGKFYNYGKFLVNEYQGGAQESNFYNHSLAVVDNFAGTGSTANARIFNACQFYVKNNARIRNYEGKQGSALIVGGQLMFSSSEDGTSTPTYVGLEAGALIQAGSLYNNGTSWTGPTSNGYAVLNIGKFDYMNWQQDHPEQGGYFANNIYLVADDLTNHPDGNGWASWDAAQKFDVIANAVGNGNVEVVEEGDYEVIPADNDFKLGEAGCTPGFKIEKDDDHNDKIRVICEDLSANEETDFDFNDVVFDVEFTSETTAKVTIVAAGGTLPLEVAGHEVHAAFGVSDTKTMINTKAARILTDELKKQGYKAADGLTAKSFTVDGIDRTKWGEDIPVRVQKNGEWYTIEATVGGPTAKIGVDLRFNWPDEKQSIKSKYEGFTGWVTDPTKLWY